MSWISFAEIDPGTAKKTKKWAVMAKDGSGQLGLIGWYARWRKYCFSPDAWSVFEEDCLREIAAFIETKTREHRAARKAAKEMTGS